MRNLTLDDVSKHNQEDDYWAVINGYVVDLTEFLSHHPAGAKKIINKRKQLGSDISPNFLDHFKHTVDKFHGACREYDEKYGQDGGEEKEDCVVVFQFKERPDVSVRIIGKISES